VALVALLGGSSSIAHAQKFVKECSGVHVQSITFLKQNSEPTAGDAQRAMPFIEMAPSAPPSGFKPIRSMTVIAVGPILGSMDSQDVATSIQCTRAGVALTAAITRSAEYHGGVKKNVLWRPRIKLVVVPLRTGATISITWRMHLTTGDEVDRAQTPPYQYQNYPVTVTRTID
jgi:hypothetical protein